jgi:vacuolar-type H+-ATPase subunit I/STV1
VYSASSPTAAWDPTEQLRILILSVGGLIGLATVVLGLVLPFTRYTSTILAGMKAWYEQRWGLTGCAVAVFGGLVLIFVSLQLARSVQRTSTSLRRLLFGYNAALGGFLLLAILVLLNVLPYGFAAFSKPIDWTEGGIYTLSDETRNFLTNLPQPVKVITLLPARHPVTPDVITLLENCHEVDPKFTWEGLSRDLRNTPS